MGSDSGSSDSTDTRAPRIDPRRMTHGDSTGSGKRRVELEPVQHGQGSAASNQSWDRPTTHVVPIPDRPFAAPSPADEIGRYRQVSPSDFDP